MLVPKKTPALKNAALSGVVILIVLVIAYLLYANFISGQLEITKPVQVNIDTRQLPTITPRLNVDFMSREPYVNLRQFGVLPVTVKQLGQPNPFLSSPSLSGARQ